MLTSPHAHIESPLSGSTIADMLMRAKTLGRTHFFYADNGHLSSALKVFRVLKEEEKRLKTKFNLKLVPGIEIYFKDPTCPIISGTAVDRCKYFTATIYCKDQVAFQELTRIVSKTDFPTIEIYEESQNLWGWNDLERISKFNIDIILGGVHCMVGKTLLADRPDLGETVLNKLNNMFTNRVYLSLICEPWTKKWNSVIQISFTDGTSTSCLSNDIVSTDRARRIKASDLIDRTGHKIIKSIVSSGMHSDINKTIDRVKLHKGFLPLPGGDASLRVNQFLKELADRYNLKLLASDYAYYSEKEDKIVQTMRLEGNNKLQPNLYMKSEDEIRTYLINTMKLSVESAETIIANNSIWASQFDNFELKYNLRLADSEKDSLKRVMDIIQKNGRMEWNNPKYVDRLKEELKVISKNGVMDLSAYFLAIYDVVSYYKANGRLTGAGRGSAAGSLLAFLLGITEVNPFTYDLSFSRFYSLDRIAAHKLADIDTDLEDRLLLVGEDGQSGYLYSRWGKCAAQISTRQNLRLKSAIKDVNRFINGKVEPYIETLTKGLPNSPQGVTDNEFVFGYENDDGEHIQGLFDTAESLQEYATKKPQEWEIVKKSLGIVRNSSVHACAFVIANCPISDVVPLRDGHITQVEAKEVEFAGLVKMDFLVVSQLKDVRVCLDLINKKNNDKFNVGYFTHKNEKTYIWDLPEDIDVYKSVWSGNTETCFQINTKSMVPYVMGILPKNMEDLSLILSLVRPGPLDFIDPDTGRNMAEEYVYRRNGGSYEDISILKDLIPETFSVLVYQEQITKIAKNLAGFTGLEAENLREAIGKKKKLDLIKMKPKFIDGVVSSNKANQKEAEELWNRVETFGRYAFNKSHGISYSYLTYACMFLKHYYPLEWWAAILTNASEKEITSKFWPYVKDIVSPPDINLSGDTMVVDYKNGLIRAKLGVIHGIGGATIEPIIRNRPYRDIQDFVNKEVAGPCISRKLIHVGVLDSLFPPKCNFLEKLKLFEDAIEMKNFNRKIEEAKNAGKQLKISQPKEGIVLEEYIELSKSPMKDAATRKSILPTLPIDLYELGKKYSRVILPYENKPSVMNSRGYSTILVNGATIEKLDLLEGYEIEKDRYVAATCFVIGMEEFSYSNDTKRALKLILDCDGYVSEKVLWPDYNTGQLMYPKDLKKCGIATVFFRKKAQKDGPMNITSVVVEA